MKNIKERNVSVMILHLLCCVRIVRQWSNLAELLSLGQASPWCCENSSEAQTSFGSLSVLLHYTQCMLQRSVNVHGMNVSIVLRVRCTRFSWK
jgi:hypothetical protein